MVFILSLIDGKNHLLTAPFVELVHCSCHFVNPISFPSVMIVSFGSLSYTISRVFRCCLLGKTVCCFVSLNPDVCLHPVKNTVHSRSSSLFISVLMFSISMECLFLFFNVSSITLLLCLPLLSFLHLLTVDFVFALVPLGMLPVLPDYWNISRVV